MNLTADIEVYSASDLSIDASVIDVSEVEAQEDKDYLVQQGTEILTIEAKADYAIKKIVATIQGRASLEKGKVIAETQDYFHGKFPRGVGLIKWYESIGLDGPAATRCANAYRSTAEFRDLFNGLVDPAKVLECSDAALAQINTLPKDYKEEVMAEVAVGNVPTKKDITELAKKPEVKLSKAQELLAAAKARKAKADEQWEEVKADPNIRCGDHEYVYAKNKSVDTEKAVSKFEQQIADLQAQVEEEKSKAADAEAREAKMNAELQKLKFDDAKSRAERIKRLTSSLTVGVPQAMADLQKFFAEQDHYPEEVRTHILEQATQLANLIGDKL